MTDTIAQIITAQTRGAVSIIRLSGPDSAAIIKKIFNNKEFAINPVSHRIYYGKVKDGDSVVDEVLVSLMLAPKSYTREDVAEINCHGGVMVTQRILSLVIKQGARPAEPGEFTKRAFLNGRIDLTQAEAVCDIINAQTEQARRLSYDCLNGELKTKITLFREAVLSMIAGIEASLDFPEHELEAVNIKIVSRKSEEILGEINKIIKTADYGRIIYNGIETAIAGRPNTGKSTLMNQILQYERAIVTATPGATRDILQDIININGIVLKLTDMAGIRDTNDPVESIGVSRAIEYIKNAELILAVFDGSQALTHEDAEVLKLICGKKAIIIINKTDLKIQINIENIKEQVLDMPIIEISAKEGKGLNLLYNCINDMFLTGTIEQNNQFALYKERHKDALTRAAAALTCVLETSSAGLSEDFLTGDLTDCYTYLGEITGETLDDDIIERIFSGFCLGK